jgi:hypothetical protein
VVVVVDDVPVLEVPVGRSDAQALRAAFTVEFEVSLALGDVVPAVPELDGPPGKATP